MKTQRQNLLNDYTKSTRDQYIAVKLQAVFTGFIVGAFLIYAMIGDAQSLDYGFIH